METTGESPTDTPPHGVPPLGTPTRGMVGRALAQGWRDFCRAPLYGVVIALFYVIIGWGMIWITQMTGHTFWLVLAAIGFPLLGPFAAIAFYEMSRRMAAGLPVTAKAILLTVWGQRMRQLPSLCSIIVFIFLFWFFIGHMIFALFLGLKPMTNITSSFEVFLSSSGLMMLGFGTVVGAGFAFLIYAMSVIGLPLLLDREVDFMTAMLTSIVLVRDNIAVMLGWAVILAVLTLAALLPGFLGLLIVLPWLGHASWHLYSEIVQSGASRP